MGDFQFQPRWQDLVPLLDKDPAEFAGTMEDRERQLEEYLDYGEETYTAELDSGGTSPTIGDTGYEFGAFSIQGRMCDAHGEILFNGAGITAGTSYYLVKLPVRPRFYTIAGNAVQQMIGSATLNDNSASTPYQGLCFISSGVSTTQFFVQIDGLAGFNLAAGSPVTVAAGDRILFQVRYMIDELA